MRLYIKNLGKGTLVVYKETTLQSIASDLLTIIVLTVAIGLDIAFSLLITHSVVIDILVVLMILLYMFGYAKNKKTEFTKEEVIEQIENL